MNTYKSKFRLSAILFLSAQMLFLTVLLLHRSSYPVVFGRFSVRLFGVVVGLALLLLVQGLLIWRAEKGLEEKWRAVITRVAQLPVLLEVIAAGWVGFFVFIFIVLPINFPPLRLWLLIAGYLLLNISLLIPVVLTPLSQERIRSHVKHGVIITIVIVIIFGLEFWARWVFSSQAQHTVQYTVMAPNQTIEQHIIPDLPGVADVSVFTTNSDGIRGDAYSPDNYNILLLGSSTTLCSYLDDTKTINAGIQQQYGQTSEGQPVWVGNIARSGYDAGQMALALQYVVPQFDIDIVIAMVGAIDTGLFLQNPDSTLLSREQYESNAFALDTVFFQHGEQDPDYIYGSALLTTISNRLDRLDPVTAELGGDFIQRREAFQNAEVVTTPPDTTAALQQYHQNLVELIRIASEQDVRLILVTQPAIWSPNMSQEAESLLQGICATQDGRDWRFTTDIMLEVLEAFNEELLTVCTEEGIECIDLASEIMGCETCFYDGWHFNEHGAQVAADVISSYLKSTEPFSD